MAALDIERAFKMYSYRIIDDQTFYNTLQEIATEIKKLR